jgi:hypothetical protein
MNTAQTDQSGPYFFWSAVPGARADDKVCNGAFFHERLVGELRLWNWQ